MSSMESYDLGSKIEERICLQDSRVFRVMKTSSQEFCSAYCREMFHAKNKEGASRDQKKKGGGGAKKLNNAAEKPLKSNGKDSMLTPPGEPNTCAKRASAGQEILRSTKPQQGPLISEIKLQETNDAQSTREKIEKSKMNTTEETTLPTVNSDSNRSMKTVNGEILPTDSSNASVNLNRELSQSISSLTSVENELLNSMKGLRRNQPDPEIKLYEPERVQAAAECGKQVISTVRMKLDLLKFAHEITKDQMGSK